tara:strand:+ start:7770 stop:9467 length:1698 start_codon:yes stop_codon:yes gene_type:complete
MANKRVFYAAKRVGIGPVGAAGGGGEDFRQLHGIQSVGITTTFNLEQTFELGQLAIYENIEGIPDVSIDIEKVLDGYCPVYLLATGSSTSSSLASTNASLVGRSATQCDFVLATYKDTDEIAGGEGSALVDRTAGDSAGAAESHVMMSGVFVSSVSYNVGIDGYATESVSLVGQDKVYFGHSNFNGDAAKFSSTDFIGTEDEPKALTEGSGGAQQRQDVLFEYGTSGTAAFFKSAADPATISSHSSVASKEITDFGGYPASGLGTVLPKQVPGVSASGTNDKDADGNFSCVLQSFTASTDFGREDIFQLGRKGRFHRFVNFPTEVTCEMTVVSQSGDLISATEAGLLGASKPGDNLVDETIRLHLREGLLVDLGKKNKLQSVSVTGGDAGGGNEEISYSFQNFNDFSVYHPEDPLLKNGGAQATATIEFSNAVPTGSKVTIAAADGTSKVFTSVFSGADGTEDPPKFNNSADAATVAASLKTAIEAASSSATAGGLGGKVTVVRDGAKLTLTQATGGVDGNTTITVADCSTTCSINGASATANPTGAFTGGAGGANFSPKHRVFL